ncbi:NEDD4-binding protein 2 [Merluccius polli]|uniref:NEDD4-binding protein 2 n=1 Tax=Merluccius polli TaxID=89951 RepID=A0AA47P6I5_MERPO|nr:NEDD4-binding protein 2 [Merluccius polli]
MPRKKKPGQSPARVPVPGLSDDATRGGGQSAVGPRRGGYEESAMAGDLSLTPRSLKEDIVRNMKEMFSHLDPEVIYIVLSECGFKVEHAMDSLLELSVAAEVVAPHPGPASGFELTAAALLSPYPSDRGPDLDPPKPSELASFPLPTSPLTEELDLLIDKELETLTGQPKEGKKQLHSQYFSAVAAPLSSFPPPPVPQQALPELLQSSLEPGTTGPGTSGDPSPIDQLSFWEEKDVKKEECVLNYSHLILPGESAGAKPNASLDLGATGRPSAFQVYKKMDTASESSRGMPSGDIRGGVRSKVVPQTWHPPSYWNPESPVFSPRSHGNQAPTFITPVALPPSPWDTRGRPASHWSNQWPGSQGSPKPPDTIPKSWAPPAVPRASATHSRLRIEGKVLVLLRGAPGSGKSTLAWSVLCHSLTEGCCCWLHSPVNKL